MSNFQELRSPLSYYERQQIEIRFRGKWTIRRIARDLVRNHSIIARELARNKSPDGKYRARWAQQEAERKTHITNKRKLDKHAMLFLYVQEGFKKDWSPEQIAGRLKEEQPSWLKGARVSHETIYQYLYTEAPDLMKLLRQKKGRYRRR